MANPPLATTRDWPLFQGFGPSKTHYYGLVGQPTPNDLKWVVTEPNPPDLDSLFADGELERQSRSIIKPRVGGTPTLGNYGRINLNEVASGSGLARDLGIGCNSVGVESSPFASQGRRNANPSL